MLMITMFFVCLSVAAKKAPEQGVFAKMGVPQVVTDLVIGGSIGAIAKTAMAPVERVKLLLQTMDSNPDVISGKVQPYKGDAHREQHQAHDRDTDTVTHTDMQTVKAHSNITSLNHQSSLHLIVFSACWPTYAVLITSTRLADIAIKTDTPTPLTTTCTASLLIWVWYVCSHVFLI